jgi:hypothetical protein
MSTRRVLVAVATAALLAFPPVTLAHPASHDSTCPGHPHQRTAAEVMAAHLAAFEAGDTRLLACDYAKDAVFIMAGTVARGRPAIEATFAGFFELAGRNIALDIHAVTSEGPFTLLEYAMDSDHVFVADGVDTLVIKGGLIIAQTAHLGGFMFK